MRELSFLYDTVQDVFINALHENIHYNMCFMIHEYRLLWKEYELQPNQALLWSRSKRSDYYRVVTSLEYSELKWLVKELLRWNPFNAVVVEKFSRT